jgi:hypothetical protein
MKSFSRPAERVLRDIMSAYELKSWACVISSKARFGLHRNEVV